MSAPFRILIFYVVYLKWHTIFYNQHTGVLNQAIKSRRKQMEKFGSNINEWQSVDHALAYLARADKLPHRTEGEKVLLDQIPQNINRVIDLGTGNGRLLGLVKLTHPVVEGVALDFSDTMLKHVRKRFENDNNVQIVKHDFNLPLIQSELGYFDAVVSSLAIHHLTHERKRQL